VKGLTISLAGGPRRRSIRLQTRLAEHSTHPLDELGLRRADLLENVRNSELMPPVLAHLVERQHVDSLDVAETGGELRDVRDPAKIIGQSRTSASGVSLWVDHVQLLLRVEHFSDLPRACLSVPSAAGMDEFASIGSNDMTSPAVEPTNACPRGHPRSHSRLCTVAAPCCSKAERPAQAAAEVVIDNPARYVARKAQVRTRSLYECENHHATVRRDRFYTSRRRCSSTAVDCARCEGAGLRPFRSDRTADRRCVVVDVDGARVRGRRRDWKR
jgi:hypothetical protein